jgi:hypothetical protein
MMDESDWTWKASRKSDQYHGNFRLKGASAQPRCAWLLVNADEHRYRLEIGMPFEMGGEVRANVTRLATFGAGDIHAVKVTVDASSSQVFLCGPLLVPGNALPVLPRAKKASEAK